LTKNFLNSNRNQGLQLTRSNRHKIDWLQVLVKSSSEDIFSLRSNSMQDSSVGFKMKCKKLFICNGLAKFKKCLFLFKACVVDFFYYEASA